MSQRIEGNAAQNADHRSIKTYVSPDLQHLGSLRAMTQQTGGTDTEFILNGQPVVGSITVITG